MNGYCISMVVITYKKKNSFDTILENSLEKIKENKKVEREREHKELTWFNLKDQHILWKVLMTSSFTMYVLQ